MKNNKDNIIKWLNKNNISYERQKTVDARDIFFIPIDNNNDQKFLNYLKKYIKQGYKWDYAATFTWLKVIFD